MIKYFCLFLFVSSVCTQDVKDESKHVRKTRSLVVDINTFKSQNLNCHNNHRYFHQSPPLSYDAELNIYAQSHADHLANTDTWSHSRGPYGENLFGVKSSDTFDGNTACQTWHNESRQYDYSQNTPPNFFDVGHFTQMVWRNSRQIGVGVATSERSGLTYVVVSYSPPGNIEKYYTDNVFPPKPPPTY